jgi:hypothetical protein
MKCADAKNLDRKSGERGAPVQFSSSPEMSVGSSIPPEAVINRKESLQRMELGFR